MKKILLRIILGISVTFILLPLLLFIKMKSALPNYSENITFESLHFPVEIQTDEYGVPHIIANDREDLYFALGYAQARERLFQMQILKRVVSGRISELVGEKGIQVDILFRHIGFRRNSEKWISENLQSSPREAVRYLDRYLEGVNSFASTHPLTVEFLILGMEYEPLERIDILAFVGFMGYGFGEGIHIDPLITDLENEFGSEMMQELTGEIATVSQHNSDLGHMALEVGNRGSSLKKLMQELGLPLFQGSNSWVVGSLKSLSKKPMFSNDPHIGFANPSIWFEAYLEAPDFQLYGHFLPMVPFAPIAFNSHHAYGLTMFENDDMDFYLEKENPDNPDEYFHKGKLMSYEITNEVIKVKSGKEINLKIKTGIHGTVLTGATRSLKNSKVSIAMKWPMYDKENHPLKTFYGFNFAKSITDFESATSHLLVPGLNVIYADVTGNIAYFPCGVLPERNFPSDRILDGESGKYEWGPYITGSLRPKSINPQNGYIYTANHKHYGNVPYKIQGYWQPDDRSLRLQKLLTEKSEYTFEDMQKMVLDDTFEGSSYILPNLFAVLEVNSNLTENEQKSFNLLKNWDRRGDINSSAALIFSELRFALMREIFLDEFGEERFNIIGDTGRIYHYLKKVYLNPGSKWWDNRKTKNEESAEEIIIRAYRSTIKILEERQGKNPDRWKWGSEHTLELRHALGEVPLLGLFFNSGPRAVNGGSETINNLLSKVSKGNHKVTAGPSMRTQIDFSDLENIKIINPLGQSGHRMGRHFQDQADLYAQGEFRTISWSKQNKKEGRSVTLLNPKK